MTYKKLWKTMRFDVALVSYLANKLQHFKNALRIL